MRDRNLELLRDYAKRFGTRVLLINDLRFDYRFSESALSCFNPLDRTIYVRRSLQSSPERLYFAVAHEIGHVIDHDSEPELAAERTFHCQLSTVYHAWDRPVPGATSRVFREREEAADEIGISVLRELGIDIDASTVKDLLH